MSDSDSSQQSMFISPLLVKPLVAGITAGLMEKYVLNVENMTQNATFGAAVAGGIVLSDMVAPYAAVGILPDTTLYSGKTVSQRALEIALSSGTAYLANRFVLRNDFNSSQMGTRLAIIAASGFIGEYISDYTSSKPLSYLV